MRTRYQLTELTVTGEHPRRIWTDLKVTANDLVYALGGRWRIERQWRNSDGRWRRDSGRQPVWEQGVEPEPSA